MSHFSVLVRLPASVREDEFTDRITELMLPYKEAGCGDNDPAELEKYLTFHDVEDEARSDYESKSSPRVRLPNGEILSKYDDRFKNPELFGEPRYIIPADAEEFEMPHREFYATFEEFMTGWRGEKRDSKTGRYGYWQNPNKRWDWWTIGGRWTGHLSIGYELVADRDNYERCWLCNGSGTRADGMDCSHCRESSLAGHPVVGRGCNACGGTGWQLKSAHKFKPIGNHLRIKHLDWEQIEAKAREKLDTFWRDWQALCEGKEFDAFEGPRERALSMGLVECKDAGELTGDEWKIIPWDKPDTPAERQRNRFDVLKQTTKAWIERNYLDAFLPISTWARLDSAEGWQEKGEMGWFGYGSDTPDSAKTHASGLRDWLAHGDPNDWIVVVDCHI